MARVQGSAFGICFLALLTCAAATSTGGYYYGHRRLSEASSVGLGRQLLTTSYYYGGHRKLSTYYYGLGNQHRRLQENAPFSVRPLFGNSFMPAAQGGAADVPVPQFLTRQLQGAGRQLTTYYYSNRRLQSRQLSTYYYGTHL